MNALKKLAAPLALAAATLLVAMPAQARDNRHDSHQHDSHQHDSHQHDSHQDAWRLTPARNTEIRQDINSLNNAINRAAARRTISQREANGLHNQARDVQRLYARFAHNGLDRAEVRNLQSRVSNVRVALRMGRRDWDSRRG